jgi:hypothetical protein
MHRCTRRSFLSTGIGALASLALLRGVRADPVRPDSRRPAGAPSGKRPADGRRPDARRKSPARACILLYMEGGPSQLDTWDPKPGQANAGGLGAINSKVAGLQVSEHLPRLAARAHDLAVVRALTSKEGNHQRARHLMHTGYPPQGGVDHPALGSILGDVRGSAAGHDLPSYISVSGPGEDAGFLSPALSPFIVQDPRKGVKFLAHPDGIDDARFGRRVDLWRGQEDGFAAAHPGVALPAGQRALGEQAFAMLAAPALSAFKLEDEPAALRASYGDGELGQGCLLARRLVEAGVGFVEITQKGWDTHKDNFPTVKRLGAELDAAFAALLGDLSDRGLLESTLVLWMGDFGRTPRINENGGRDHFPACSSVVLAGGGVRGGAVVGASSADGMEVRDRPVTVPDLFRTVATLLGLDADTVRVAPSGRPIKTVDGGTAINEILV